MIQFNEKYCIYHSHILVIWYSVRAIQSHTHIYLLPSGIHDAIGTEHYISLSWVVGEKQAMTMIEHYKCEGVNLDLDDNNKSNQGTTIVIWTTSKCLSKHWLLHLKVQISLTVSIMRI